MKYCGKDWLDHTGCFIFGKHHGEKAERVAQDDPGYIRWIVGSVEECSDEDREILSALIDR